MGFDPVSLGIASLVVSTAGVGLSASAASQSASYQAQVARNNAITAEQNAEYASKAGEAQALTQGLKGRARVAAIKTKQAANGVDVNTGSAVDVRAGEAETGMLDTLTTKNNALLSAYGYRTQATSDTAQAGLDQAQADFAPIAGGLSAAGGLLGGASSLGFKWQASQGGDSFVDAGGSYGGNSLPGYGAITSSGR